MATLRGVTLTLLMGPVAVAPAPVDVVPLQDALSVRVGGRIVDLTVEGTHNFVANGVIAHNSLEQDADVVMFLYRDEVYNKDAPDNAGKAEVILAKHRNGPTGQVDLAFVDSYARFANMGRD